MPDLFAGRFELIDPIGTGGTGTVWRAWDRRLERYCAAKVLRQRHAGALLRFVREQGRRLDHPHILSPYGWAADDDQALLAMDLIGGGALSNLSADFGPLPERYVAELLRQLLEALAHIHELGVVHRDVKPANLLLEATGTGAPSLRLTDFGIALALGEPRLTQQGTIVGTPGYLAPEILAGALPSIRQDLYAAGITAHQLLTGQEPASHSPAGLAPASHEPPGLEPAAGAPHPHRPPGTPATALWAVVEALLHPDPTKRADSATTSLTNLKPALADPLHLPAHTADNELIEVFDHLPPLPSRPTATNTAPTPQPATTHVTPHPTAQPTPTPASPHPTAQSAPTHGPTQPAAHREGPGPAARPPIDQATTSRADGQAPDSHPSADEWPSGEGPSRERSGGERSDRAADGRRRRVLVVAGASLAVAAVATTAVLLTQGDPGNNLRPTGGSTTPTTSPTTPTISPTATPSLSSTPPPVPTGSPNPIPDPEVKLGATCGWQEAGTLETAANGIRVECRKHGSTYRWIRAT
ncbi:protein kinase [Kribbella sp. NBC_01245]|uniref:serine/threonine-protein kinase n=1 Tax=Kribbella sp. NBC_01245 TaxID=2903578 RepID=UPI002E27C7CD|nr:protein kinase [Kribbella sp. NBC_01245]